MTCLSVVIGTASIVVMISPGIGLKVSMEESMAQWGSLNIIRIYPGCSMTARATRREKRGASTMKHWRS